MDNELYQKFDTAWVVGPSKHDLRMLNQIAEDVRFITSGLETTQEQVDERIDEFLDDYNHTRDIIIPLGRATVNVQIGFAIARLYPNAYVGRFHHDRRTGKKQYIVQEFA